MTRRLELLTVDDCLALLRGRYVGRVAFTSSGHPTLRPVNYVLDEGSIVFRTSLGELLDDVLNSGAVAFEIDDIDVEDHTGWSVIVHGKAEEIWQPEELGHARSLPLRPWAPGEREHYVRIAPNWISGRRIVVG